MKFDLAAARQEFHDGDFMTRRWTGWGDIKVMKFSTAGSIIAYLRIDKVAGFKIGPTWLLYYSRHREKQYLSGSVGYSTKFPRQYELFLTPKRTYLLNSTTNDYIEFGNSKLRPEKQLTGNLSFGLGKVGSDLLLSLTAGKIWEGVDWNMRPYIDTTALSLTAFSPVNHYVQFADLSIRQRAFLKKSIHWLGGAALHYIKVEKNTDPPYAPVYQAFSGLELYHYIQTLDLHLYAYGEMVFVGRYHGLHGTRLGEKPIANAKLSFRIKKFRFYYVFQDILNLIYQNREDYSIEGRYNFYGFTWEFLD